MPNPFFEFVLSCYSHLNLCRCFWFIVHWYALCPLEGSILAHHCVSLFDCFEDRSLCFAARFRIVAVVSVQEVSEAFDMAADIGDHPGERVVSSCLSDEEMEFVFRADPFDEIATPPSSGYTTDEPTIIQVGDVLVARSRTSTSGCSFLGAIARYGKFRVLSLDSATGEVRLELLVNANCAFRNLEPGVPTE